MPLKLGRQLWQCILIGITLLCMLYVIRYQRFVQDITSNPYFENRSLKYTIHAQPERNLTDMWSYVSSLVGNDTLYPEDLDMSLILDALRTARITHARLFGRGTSLKWMLNLEGGARAIFKPELIPKDLTATRCNVGCEHPEYEVAGLAINRMLNLRNMPYVTGRVISWTEELLPVADASLIDIFTVDEDAVCCSDTCLWQKFKTTRCFPKGQIVGVIIYVLPFQLIEYKKLYFMPWWNAPPQLPFPIGKNDTCALIRQDDYKEESVFADTTDFAVADFLMSHMDTKHYFIKDAFGKRGMNVVLDSGRAFCPATKFIPSNLMPLIRCCKIRKRVYEALVKYKDNFVEKFISLTKDDLLFPTLSDKILATFQPRIQQLLGLVHLCIEASNSSFVMMDL